MKLNEIKQGIIAGMERFRLDGNNWMKKYIGCKQIVVDHKKYHRFLLFIFCAESVLITTCMTMSYYVLRFRP